MIDRAYGIAHDAPLTIHRSEWTVAYVPMIPWITHRDERGCWCVERLGAWSCRVTLTGASSQDDVQQEERARRVADALNRVYAANPFPGRRDRR